MIISIVAVLLGCIAIFNLTRWLRNRKLYNEMIDRMPGPPGVPLFGVLFEMMVPPDQIWCCLRRYAKQYGPIYRLRQLHKVAVNLFCPDDIEILLSTTKHMTKSDLYRAFRSWLGTGLLISSGTKWQHRRKILTPSVHFNILQQFIPIFVEESEVLVQELQEECEKSFTDVEPLIGQFTLNSVCQTAMGTRLEKTDKNARDYATAILRIGEVAISRVLRPWYQLDAMFCLFPIYREQKKLINILHGFSESVIKTRKLNFKEPDLFATEQPETFTTRRRLAMLDLLISAKNSGQPIDDEGIREEVDTFMFGGHDTITACISFTLLLLACHGDIQEKVVQELQEVFGDSKRSPTFQDLQDLRYLEQVLKESLRMYPSVPFVSRVTDEDMHTHTGYTIPKDTMVLIHIYDLHHNPDIYPEPEKFDPERFSAENSSKRHPFAYIPFSAGPRNCIGQKFALLEIKIAMSAILRNFILKPIDTPSDLTMRVHITIKTVSGIKVKFERRQK